MSSDLNAHRLTYTEQGGEIVPTQTGPNAPIYPSRADRDVEMPHDSFAADLGETVIDNSEVTIPDNVREIIRTAREKLPNYRIQNSAENATPRYIQGRKRVLG